MSKTSMCTLERCLFEASKLSYQGNWFTLIWIHLTRSETSLYGFERFSKSYGSEYTKVVGNGFVHRLRQTLVSRENDLTSFYVEMKSINETIRTGFPAMFGLGDRFSVHMTGETMSFSDMENKRFVVLGVSHERGGFHYRAIDVYACHPPYTLKFLAEEHPHIITDFPELFV